MDTSRYAERRRETLEEFAQMVRLENTRESFTSPSGRYLLETQEASKGGNTWSYVRGVITRVADSVEIAEVIRNYGVFWHCWVQHLDGSEYLLCGEDYQGYNVIDLDNAANNCFFPSEAFDGVGFCWTKVHPSPDGFVLAVEGCYWACPYELVFYDFRDPSKLPLPELARLEEYDDVTGWRDNNTLEYSQGESSAECVPATWQRSSSANLE